MCVQVVDSTNGLAGNSPSAKQAQALQQSSTAADICRPLVDSVKAWESIAAAEYGFDGVMEGWDTDSKKAAETSEDKFLQVMHCCWLFVAILQDCWCRHRLMVQSMMLCHFSPLMLTCSQAWLTCSKAATCNPVKVQSTTFGKLYSPSWACCDRMCIAMLTGICMYHGNLKHNKQ